MNNNNTNKEKDLFKTWLRKIVLWFVVIVVVLGLILTSFPLV
ncbi:MAG: hypothetical protein KatS3mg097_150 [Candidatus Parcubacteria bacterium]|nr:MAG: hypothetical protein KatS3mg097_150 [Candidatus Parcubacteria bacterium]